jgi:broad specificity phosphatase PhoE
VALRYNDPVVEALRLFVVRQGGTEWTAERRFTGGRDVPLSVAGQARVEAVARALAPHAIAAVYASPLERARTTAEMIAKPHRRDVTVDAAFRDMGFGAWEGLTAGEVAARAPEAWTLWREAPHTLAAHAGEPLPDVAARVMAGVARLQHVHPGASVMLVTHAIPSRLIVLAALGLGAERLWSVDASPGGLSELEYAPDWVTVHRMNTIAHLAPAASGAGPDCREEPGAEAAP